MNGQALGSEVQVHELVRKRRSPYAFSSEPVELGTLAALFEAARWAPSSFNEQPWQWVMARREETEHFNRLLSVLVPFNAEWARRAPVLVIAIARLQLGKTGEANRHAFYDLGQAMAWLTAEATSRGLAVHQMAGFDAAKARDVLRVPAGYEPVAVAAIGYPGEPQTLPETLRARELGPRARRPLEELVFEGSWGEPWKAGAPARAERSTS